MVKRADGKKTRLRMLSVCLGEHLLKVILNEFDFKKLIWLNLSLKLIYNLYFNVFTLKTNLI